MYLLAKKLINSDASHQNSMFNKMAVKVAEDLAIEALNIVSLTAITNRINSSIKQGTWPLGRLLCTPENVIKVATKSDEHLIGSCLKH